MVSKLQVHDVLTAISVLDVLNIVKYQTGPRILKMVLKTCMAYPQGASIVNPPSFFAEPTVFDTATSVAPFARPFGTTKSTLLWPVTPFISHLVTLADFPPISAFPFFNPYPVLLNVISVPSVPAAGFTNDATGFPVNDTSNTGVATLSEGIDSVTLFSPFLAQQSCCLYFPE